MKYTQDLNFIYNNEYIYQIQNRLYNSEKKHQNEIKQQTELLLYQSWSFKKNYVAKYENVSNKDLIYVKLLKETQLSKKHTENFIYFKFLDAILCFEKIKLTKKYPTKIQIIKKIYFFSQSNLFFIKSCLTNSILLFLVNSITKENLYYSLINNYDKKIYVNFFKLFKKINKTEHKDFILFENSFNSNFFWQKNFKHKLNKNKKKVIFVSNISLQSFSFYFPSEVFNFSVKKKLLKYIKIKNLVTNTSIVSYFPTQIIVSDSNHTSKHGKEKNFYNLNIIETLKKKHYKTCPIKFKTFSNNQFIYIDNTYKLFFLKKLEKNFSLTPICVGYLYKIFHSSSSITISLKEQFKTCLCNKTSFSFNFSKLKMNNASYDLFYKIYFINTTFQAHLILNSSFSNSTSLGTSLLRVPLSKSMIRYKIGNFLQVFKLNELKTSFKIFFKILLIKFKHRTILMALDKYILSSKIKNLLLYLFLLEPKLQNKISKNCFVEKKSFSKNENIALLVEKLKMNSKYFVHTIFDDCLKFRSNTNEEKNYFQFNSSQLKILTKKLQFSSYLFNYLVKNFNPSYQSSSCYYTNGKYKNLTFLFFNILLNGLGTTLKHSIIKKKRKINFLSINFIIRTKNISVLLQKNSSFISKHNSLTLPQFLYYKNQILILTKNSTILSECVKFLRKFLYLQRFMEQFIKFKLGHSLFTYNNNKPGFDFLGFFISQHNQQNITNLEIKNTQFVRTISLSKAISLNTLSRSKIILENKKILNDNGFFKSYFNNLIITNLNPSKKEILIHFRKLKEIIKSSSSITQEYLIVKLSSHIRIWSYYYNTNYNNKILNYCDYLLFKLLWRWSCRRHPKKNKKWIKHKYFHQINGKNWIFGIYKSQNFYLFCLPNHTDIKFFKPNLRD
jgi:hypothetical protein